MDPNTTQQPTQSSAQPPAQPTSPIPPPVDQSAPSSPQEDKQETALAPPPKNTNKLILIVVIVILFLFFAGASVGAYFLYFTNPLDSIEKSLGKFEDLNSIVVSFTSAEDDVVTKLTLHADGTNYSQIDATINKLGESENQTFSASIIVNEAHAYLKTYYTDMQAVINQVIEVYPPIVDTQTYTMTLPVLMGKTWLHMAIPEYNESASGQAQPSIPEKDLEELKEIFIRSIVVNEHDKRYKFRGSTYERIVLGFKQQELINLLDKTKDLDLDVELSDINMLIDLVETVPNWDDNIIEILIDSDGYLYSITLSAPYISEETIEKMMEDRLDEGSTIAEGIIEQYSGNITEMLGLTEKEGSTILIGTIVFTNYNNAPSVQPPTNTVELESIMLVAQEEILPIIGAFLMQAGDPSQEGYYQDQGAMMQQDPNTVLGTTSGSSEVNPDLWNERIPQWFEDAVVRTLN